MEPVELAKRIENHLRILEKMTSTPGHGVTRLPFSAEAREASDYLKNQMEAIGLAARIDATGSVVGRLEGVDSKTVISGSHYDSVVEGGAFDGIAGVICALEAVRLLTESGGKLKRSVEVVATNDEEGARFKSGLFTGKVYWGHFKPDDLKRYVDSDGVSIYEAMKDYGLDPEQIQNARRNPQDITAFIETHIEQGPILEQAEKELGIVTTIVGIRRNLVTIHGRADHIGTMPMNMRKDAMEMAAHVIASIGECARRYEGAVATVGSINVKPNIINIIPSEVTFTVDFRSPSASVINAQSRSLKEKLEEVTKRFGGTYEISEVLDASPVDMDKKLRKLLIDSCVERGFSHMELLSGAGHDAQIIGEKVPTAMIFAPSIGGRSHCPEEFTDYLVLAKATLVLFDVLKELCLA